MGEWCFRLRGYSASIVPQVPLEEILVLLKCICLYLFENTCASEEGEFWVHPAIDTFCVNLIDANVNCIDVAGRASVMMDGGSHGGMSLEMPEGTTPKPCMRPGGCVSFLQTLGHHRPEP